MKKCSISGCKDKHLARGMCKKHYENYWRSSNFERKNAAPGTGCVDNQGYRKFHVGKRKYKHEHVLIAEKTLGKRLPKDAQVHHVNGIRSDNRNCNLVICQDAAYHHLLHVRQRALEECGNANYYKCSFCQKYDDPENMKKYYNQVSYYHGRCKYLYSKQRKLKVAA